MNRDSGLSLYGIILCESVYALTCLLQNQFLRNAYNEVRQDYSLSHRTPMEFIEKQ